MRQSSSCAPNYSQCKNANLPNYFCCPSGQKCIPLAGNTTLLCCPDGSDCQRIQPVPCDISLQDGEKNPDAVVKTTALGGTLSRCGGQCCPFGYSCDGKECVMDRNQNAVPIQTSTRKAGPTSTISTRTGATSSTTSTSAPPDPTNTSEPSTTSSASNAAATTSSGPPVAAIAGGATAAAVVLIGAAVLAFIFLRKKKKKSEAGSPPKLSRSTSSFGNLISGPIMFENSAFRSDFAARVSGPRDGDPVDDPASVTGAVLGSSVNTPDAAALAVPPAAVLGQQQPDNTSQQAGIAYGGYGGLDASEYAAAQFVDMPYVDPDPDGGLLAPQTPRQNREPSSVSINIFADPNITPDRTPESGADRRYSDMTTFTQMLDKADLGGIARGESYLPDGQNGAQATPPVPKR